MRIGDFSPVFGSNIRYLRSLCGLTQKTLGLLVGVEGYEIRKLEHARGAVHLDSRIFKRFSQVFGVDMIAMTEKDLKKEKHRLPVYTDPDYPPIYEDTVIRG